MFIKIDLDDRFLPQILNISNNIKETLVQINGLPLEHRANMLRYLNQVLLKETEVIDAIDTAEIGKDEKR